MTLTTRRPGTEAGDSVRTRTSQGTLRTRAGSPSEAGTEAGVAVALSAEAPALGQLRVPEDGGPATCRRQPAAVLGPARPGPAAPACTAPACRLGRGLGGEVALPSHCVSRLPAAAGAISKDAARQRRVGAPWGQ